MSKLEVKWTGSYPSLCCGKWIIKYNGEELKVPEEVVNEEMNTYGEYNSWYFDDNMCEQDNYYIDGLDCGEWTDSNMDWIVKMFEEKDIDVTAGLLDKLFEKIQEEDFRSGSCGGCI